jgi:hypothetical protein|tara:strand:+ start:273 stop:542 length:270 start_codon:yes stop_codon:yes gene_type:complete
MSDKNLSVWFELPKAETIEEAKQSCAALNKMMKKLGVNNNSNGGPDGGGGFFVYQDEFNQIVYNYEQSGGSYEELDDRGKWFNLDYLAQ